MSFNNITRLAFGKRCMNSEGVLDEQGLEFKAIVGNLIKLNASLTVAEHIPWLRWMFPLEKDALDQLGARRDRLTRAIMEEHTLAVHKTNSILSMLCLLSNKNMILVRTPLLDSFGSVDF